MKAVLYLLLIGGVAALIYTGRLPFDISVVERTPPSATFAAEPPGLGREPGKAVVRLADSGSGLLTYQAVLLQSGEKSAPTSLVVGEGSFEPETSHTEVEITLPAVDKRINEGAAELVVTVVDRSFFKNETALRRTLLVDATPPRIQVLTRQHVASQGGAELVIFKATDSASRGGSAKKTDSSKPGPGIASIGVRTGDHWFPAFPAGGLSPELESHEDVYASLFAIPLGHPLKEPPTIEVRDHAGNRTASALHFTLKPKRQQEVSPALSEDFIRTKVLPLAEEFVQSVSGFEVPDDLVEIFILVNERYREHLQKRLGELTKESAPELLWKGVFAKPMPSATSSTFGELRSYQFDSRAAGSSRHDGLDLASVTQDAVRAAHDGTVLLAEPFGIYGEAVVVDHGAGLISLYGHLSSISVEPGQAVTQGMELGRSGQSGLAGGDHLHFEFRLHNVPVDPREWWDDHWIKDNIVWKIETALERLTGTPASSGAG